MKKYQLSTPSGVSTDFEADLNDQQLEAVTAGEGAVQIVAGAGSGKTRALTYRVAFLIEQGVDAREIVLCTFTNKAAREMLGRVEHLVSTRARDVRGGTFHHLANTILRKYAAILGYTVEFSILDGEDSRDLMSASISEIIKNNDRMLPRPAVLTGLVSLASNTLVPLDQIVLDKAPSLAGRLDEVLAIARDYRRRKREMNVMDFDDLLSNFHTILTEHQREAREIAESARHVLVDEYQDTNLIQSEIVDDLAAVNGNLTVVGDDAQSIYSFRGATPENMLSFKERWPESKLYKLEVNYRSTPQVLALANKSIENNPGQLPKRLMATRPDGQKPALVTVRDVDDQASFVAQRALELFEEGTSLSDIAVL